MTETAATDPSAVRNISDTALWVDGEDVIESWPVDLRGW